MESNQGQEQRNRRRCGEGGKHAGDNDVAVVAAGYERAAFAENFLRAHNDGINEECEGVEQNEQKVEQDLLPCEGGSFSFLCFFVRAFGQLHFVGKYAAAFNHPCVIALHNNLHSAALGRLSFQDTDESRMRSDSIIFDR